MLFIGCWVARSYASSRLSSRNIWFWDLGYKLCCTTVKERYAYRLAKSFLSYSNDSQCLDCIFVVYRLADQLYDHIIYSIGEVIFRHTHTLRVKPVSYLEIDFRKRKNMFTTGSVVVGVKGVFKEDFVSSSTACCSATRRRDSSSWQDSTTIQIVCSGLWRAKTRSSPHRVERRLSDFPSFCR